MKRHIVLILISIVAVYADVAVGVPDLSPIRGATKSQVIEQYGQPIETRGPVGDPPITRWIYSDFYVVFEYDRALHAFPRDPNLENLPSSAISPRPDPATGDTLALPD